MMTIRKKMMSLGRKSDALMSHPEIKKLTKPTGGWTSRGLDRRTGKMPELN